MSDKVKRQWGLDQGMPSLSLSVHARRGLRYSFRCPGCDRWREGRLIMSLQMTACECGCLLRVRINATLEELEPNA